MGRPKQALISRSAVLEVALEIISKEGLDALSIRHIADKVGVNGASLYHHFKNKDEILVGAAELALARTPLRLPDEQIDAWQELLFVGVLQLRDFMLAHPELVSVIIRRSTEGFANRFLEHVTRRLLDAGIPVGIIAPLYEALERLTIGSVVREIADNGAKKPKLSVKQFPLLAEATSKRTLEAEQIFEMSVLGITNAFEQYAQQGKQATSRQLQTVKKRRAAGTTSRRTK